MRYRLLLGFIILFTGVPVAAQTPVVFGPGTISVEGNNLYKGSFAPDGQSFYFFRKVTEGEEDYRIFVSHLTEDGWSKAEQVVLGEAGHSDLYPAVSPDGNHLVFSSYRPAGGEYDAHPNANLWIARRTETGWSAPELLHPLSTPGHYHSGTTFDADGTLRYKSITRDWRQTIHRMAKMKNGGFTGYENDPTLAAWADWRRGEVYVWDGVESPDRSLMMLDVSEIGADGRRGPTDQWVALREGEGWAAPVRLGPAVNTDRYENFVVFSPEGTHVYFARGFTTYYRMPVDEVREAAMQASRNGSK